MIELDHQLLLLINGMHNDFLDALMWLISGKTVWIPFYVLTLWAVWKNRGWSGVAQILVMVGVMMLFTDTINSFVIRPVFHRLRPANLDSPVGQFVHIVNDYRGGKFGFPSAHAANYCGLSIVVYYFLRTKRLLASLMTLTLVVCYSRAYLGVHYPADLLAGCVYATIVAGVLMFLHHKYYPLKEIEIKYDWVPGLAALASLVAFVIIALIQA